MSRSERGEAARDWWHDEINAKTGPARALAARLRRAASASEVLSEPAVFRLSQALNLRDPARLALVARALAAVKGSGKAPLARRLGRGDTPALSHLRFQRLIRTTDPADLGRALRRALPMVDGECNVAQLARDLCQWDDATRNRWCFDYFGAAAPEQTTDTKEENTQA